MMKGGYITDDDDNFLMMVLSMKRNVLDSVDRTGDVIDGNIGYSARENVRAALPEGLHSVMEPERGAVWGLGQDLSLRAGAGADAVVPRGALPLHGQGHDRRRQEQELRGAEGHATTQR